MYTQTYIMVMIKIIKTIMSVETNKIKKKILNLKSTSFWKESV